MTATRLINKVRFPEPSHPVRQVGAVLEQGISHPGQSGRAHLMTHALLTGADRARVDLLLEQVGLEDAAEQRCGDHSLGMRQRLAVATALLGDPSVRRRVRPGRGKTLRNGSRCLKSSGCRATSAATNCRTA